MPEVATLRGLLLSGAAIAAGCTGTIGGDGLGGDGSPHADTDARRADDGAILPDVDARRADDGGLLPDVDAGPLPPGRGADVPWLSYEAEDGRTTGDIVGPGRALGTPAGEASGRRAVILDATGEGVAWTTRAPANAIVVRHSIPDAPGGGGTRATLGLYVDGRRVTSLQLSSKEAWIYGGDDRQVNDPAAGSPRRLYTEAHQRLAVTIPRGATVELRKDDGDRAPSYAIDLIDLELVGDALPRPAGFIAVTDGGHPWAPAIADDGVVDDAAFEGALRAAMAGEFAGVYIPPGTFDQGHKYQIQGTTIAGAGVWYSTIYNADLAEDPGYGQTGFIITGSRARFRDFAIFGNTDGLRTQGGKAWVNSAFDDTVIENMWVENVQCGYWVGGHEPSNRLQIRHSRFRNTGADAVNLCNGTADSVVEHTHARNTGDDAFAIWSARDLYPHPATNNVIRHCTVQVTWRAAGFAIYGGRDNRIEDSVAADTITYPGLTVSSEFDPFPLESATVDGLTLVRTGGRYWGDQEFGAIWLRADQRPISNITIRNVDVVDPTYAGIHIQGEGGGALSNVLVEAVTITGAPTFGIQVKAGAAGRATFKDVTIRDPGVAAVANQAGAAFTIDDGGGNRW